MKSTWRGVSEKLLIGSALAATLGLSFLFVFFAWPGVDDMARYFRGEMAGIDVAAMREYKWTTGRWVGIRLSYLASAAMDLNRWYPVLLIVIILTAIASIYWLVRTLSEEELKRRYCWLIAIGFFSIYWAGMLRPADTLYYLTGSIENFLSVAISILAVTAAARLYRLRGRGWIRFAAIAALASLCFVAVALHELFGTILLIALAAGSGMALLLGRGDRIGWIVSTVGAGLGMRAVVMAPGNFIRSSRLSDERSIAESLSNTLNALGESIPIIGIDWLLDLKLFSAIVLLVTAVPIQALPLRWTRWNRGYWTPAVVATLLACLTVGLILPAWILGSKPPPRVLNGLYMIFLVVCLVLSFRFAPLVSSRWGRSALLHRVRLGAAIALFVSIGLPLAAFQWGEEPVRHSPIPAYHRKVSSVSDLFYSNLNRGIDDLRFWLLPYHRSMQDRYRYLKSEEVQGLKTVILEPLPLTPFMIRSNEASHLPRHSYNLGLAHYFGVESLRIPDVRRNEISLGQGRLGHLRLLSPREKDGASRLFQPLDADHFRLRPPPLRLEQPSIAVIDIIPGRSRSTAVSARIGIEARGPVYGPASVAMELFSQSGAEGMLLDRSELVLSQDDGWVTIQATAATEPASIRFTSKSVRGGPSRPAALLIIGQVRMNPASRPGSRLP